jgi:hypothetical protein
MAKKTKKAAKAKSPKTAKKAPQQERLLDDMPKDKRLDGICRELASIRDEKNKMITEETAQTQLALRILQSKPKGEQHYKAHKIELVLVAGDEKLRVRKVNDDNGDRAGDDETGE